MLSPDIPAPSIPIFILGGQHDFVFYFVVTNNQKFYNNNKFIEGRSVRILATSTGVSSTGKGMANRYLGHDLYIWILRSNREGEATPTTSS